MTDRLPTNVSPDVFTTGSGRGIIVLDMSYTLAMFRERRLEQALDGRKLGGYFDDVISVHPLAALFAAEGERVGPPSVTTLDDAHLFVEGRIGRAGWRGLLAPFGFIAAQAALVREVLRLARARDISLVRVGDPYYLGLMGWLLARRLGVPLAIRVPFRYDEIRRTTGRATMPRLFRYGWVEKCIEHFVFPRCDLVAGANEDNMRYALENGGRSEVATVFRYGNLLFPAHWVPPEDREDATAALREVGLTGRRFVITVARLDRMKHVDDTIRVVAELRRAGIDVHGLIVGDGGLRDELQQLASSLGVEAAIVFAGNRDQRWLAAMLPHAEVVVSPHMGRALAEAALSAVPLVAYDYDWQREVVVSDETGYLVPNGDWRTMAARTKTLLDDRALAETLGRNARARTAAMMDPDRLMQHETAVYTELLTRWRARGRRGRSGHDRMSFAVAEPDR